MGQALLWLQDLEALALAVASGLQWKMDGTAVQQYRLTTLPVVCPSPARQLARPNCAAIS